MELNIEKNSLNNKTAQGFPVQIVMMTILGIVLLSMGFYLSASIFDSGSDFTADLSNELRTNIDSRYCDGSSPLCAPRIVIRGEDSDVVTLFAVNLEAATQEYTLKVNSHSSTQKIINASCGTLAYDEYSRPIQIASSTSAEIPMAVSKRNVDSVPCSFTTTMWLEDGSGAEVPDSRTPLIIRVE